MDTDIMNQQDEDRIDPDESPFAGGISEFARLEEEREALIAQGVEPEDLVEPLEPTMAESLGAKLDGEFVPDVPLTTKETNPKDAIANGKASVSVVPVPVIFEIGLGMTEGDRKYGGYNYRVAGVRPSVYYNATLRHLAAWWEGEDIDPESGLHHITKALSSLTVLRDAQMNGMIAQDDRPPTAREGWMARAHEQAREIIARYPDPVPGFTQAEIAHTQRQPVNIYAGAINGFDVEVQLPAPEANEGFVWMRQGDSRDNLDQAVAVLQALRDDGYESRVIRVVRVSDRIEEMANGQQFISGELREVVRIVFPGDPELDQDITNADGYLPGEDPRPNQ